MKNLMDKLKKIAYATIDVDTVLDGRVVKLFWKHNYPDDLSVFLAY